MPNDWRSEGIVSDSKISIESIGIINSRKLWAVRLLPASDDQRTKTQKYESSNNGEKR